MITVKMDATGEYDVKWSGRDDARAISTARALLAHNASLPPEARLPVPLTDRIQAQLDAAEPAAQVAVSGEQARAAHSTAFDNAIAVAVPRAKLAIQRLKGVYGDNLATLEQWGLATVKGARGVSVRQPKTAPGWVSFVSSYVTKEESLAPEARVTDPLLDEMKGHATALSTHFAGRGSSQTQREQGVSVRDVAAARLGVLLQAAAVYLVAVSFDGRVTRDLASYGFEVIASRSASAKEAAAAAEVTPAPAELAAVP